MNNKFINNEIEESYCSFEVSKLLKKMGMAIPTKKAFRDTGIEMEEEPYDEDTYETDYYLQLDNFIYRPTHALAIKWIWANYQYHIYTCLTDNAVDRFMFKIDHCHIVWSSTKESGYKTSKKATEAALLFFLNNIINTPDSNNHIPETVKSLD